MLLVVLILILRNKVVIVFVVVAFVAAVNVTVEAIVVIIVEVCQVMETNKLLAIFNTDGKVKDAYLNSLSDNLQTPYIKVIKYFRTKFITRVIFKKYSQLLFVQLISDDLGGAMV